MKNRYKVRRQPNTPNLTWCVWDTQTREIAKGGFFGKDYAYEACERWNRLGY
jgi:hypothetical protein